MAERSAPALKSTPLGAWHAAHGARMVPFAGYAMPVQYRGGIIAEHGFTRESAGLFDVSHMGQCHVYSPDWETTARALEALVPADILGLKPGQLRYSQLTNEDGGTIDDLMITRSAAPGFAGWAYLVVNAGCKSFDYEHIARHLPPSTLLRIESHVALIALQGPAAVEVLGALVPGVRELAFMTALGVSFEGHHLHISRSGYTGEDGFEISMPNTFVLALWERLLADARVRPVGLGARDSLRLEAGLSLYGHELDLTISPVEAGLQWSIQKRRRAEGGFPGATRILRELREGPRRILRGIRPEGRQPAREGTEVIKDGTRIGQLTSGGFAPSIGGPVALGLIDARFFRPGNRSLPPAARQGSCRQGGRTALRTPSLRALRAFAPRRLAHKENSMSVYFTKDHEYLRIDGDIATVGITDYAQGQLGDVVFVELPEIGRHFKQGAQAAVVESVKAASDVYAPVTGEVTAINAALPDNPALVNEDPEGRGWFMKIRLADRGEIAGMLDEAAYRALIA